MSETLSKMCNADTLPFGAPLNIQPGVRIPNSGFRNPQSAIYNPDTLPFGAPLNIQPGVRTLNFAFFIPQSAIHNPQSAIVRRRGAMLLEVILALTILFMGMAVIGIQMRTSIATGYDNERQTQALMLAEAKLDQLDSGAINLQRELNSEGIMEGDFGKSFPGYFYRFTIEPHQDMEDIFEVKTEILFGPPDLDLEPGDIEDAKSLITLWSFRPTPATLNLQRDFGFGEEQMDELATALPPDMDPSDISPAAFAEMDLLALMDLLPLLTEVFGQGFGFSPEQIQQAIDSGLLDPTNLPTGADALNGGVQSGSQPRGGGQELGGGRTNPRGEGQGRGNRS